MPPSATVRVGLERGTGNFWIDTGLVVLVHDLGEGEYGADYVVQHLLERITEKTGNKGLYYDTGTGQVREYEKTDWVYPVNIFIKVPGDPGKKVTIEGKTYHTQPPAFKLKINPSRKYALCDICGEESQVTDAKMWMFPFLVDPDKFANFYPGVKRGAKFCVRCAVAGLSAYLGWLWKAQGQDALHFFIFHSELDEMERLHRSILRPLSVQSGRGGNAPVAFFGPYVHETTLGLLLQLFSHVRSSDVLDEEGRRALAQLFGAAAAAPPPITLYAISGKPGQAFKMTAFWEISRVHELFRLYDRWLATLADLDGSPHARVVQVFRQFQAQRDKNWESLWRDRVARAVLAFEDPFPFVEQFLYEERARSERRPLERGTTEVFQQYGREVMGMEEQFQRILAGFGHSLGMAAYENNEMGILYELRNAKNPEAFYRVLNDAQFRLQATVPEALVRIEKGERIADVPWVRVKTILSIFAMNAFLRKASNQQGQS